MSLYDDLVSILACAQTELVLAGRSIPQEVYVSPGLVAFDECTDGQLWARVIRANPTTEFPNAFLGVRGCDPEIATLIGLGIVRCQTGLERMEQPGGHPTPAEFSSDASGVICDMGALMRALLCCYKDTENAQTLILDSWTQLDPQGVVGGEWQAWISSDLYCEADSPGDSP